MYVHVFPQLEEKEKNNKEEIEKLRKQLADLEEKFLEVFKKKKGFVFAKLKIFCSCNRGKLHHMLIKKCTIEYSQCAILAFQ